MHLNRKDEITREDIKNFVDKFYNNALLLDEHPELNEDEKRYVIRVLESIHETTMGFGGTLKDEKHTPWLDNERANIEWYYWDRYRQLLVDKNFGSKVISATGQVTDEILDLLQNPKNDGKWQRKGLVVGQVQSGKTANYSGLICKAFDSGYKVVIVLAGLLNSLRRQTQERIDEGIVGQNSSTIYSNRPWSEKRKGVGKYDRKHQPITITTVDGDFNMRYANQLQTSLENYSAPVVFVVKKNVSIIKNIINWLNANNSKFNLNDFPMLLIDDEADHASINTNNSNTDPTKTNNRIRQLLDLFPKNIYLGYTATPFANIFIDPDTPEDMENDLFPENFIKSLDSPSNYLGPERIYSNSELDTIIEINDFEDTLPLRHKIDDIPQVLPESLYRSIRNFVLVCAIRRCREDIKKHNSMLINVSRFTGIQSAVRMLVYEYLESLRSSISGHYALPKAEALKNKEMIKLNEIYNEEYNEIDITWDSIQSELHNAVSKITTIEVNGSPKAEKEINYTEEDYPNGRSVIAIGGLSLSRGITLEGLSVSYFLRNSFAYDTLMQMGRWFGYRPGYEDLCRVYMPSDSIGYYKHISDATLELRQEFDKMIALNRTPKDFGLAVRNHPESLLVTARNKMRSGQDITRTINLGDRRLIQTSRLTMLEKHVSENLNAAGNLYQELKKQEALRELGQSHKIWKDVDYKCVIKFLDNFKNHPLSVQSDPRPLKEFINTMVDDNYLTKWNIVFANIATNRSKHEIDIPNSLSEIIPSIRNGKQRVPQGILLPSRQLLQENIRTIDLSDSNAERDVPLLVIYLLDVRYKKEPLYKNGAIAYGMVLPGPRYIPNEKVTVTYRVNTTWLKEYYDGYYEDENDIGEDIEE